MGKEVQAQFHSCRDGAGVTLNGRGQVELVHSPSLGEDEGRAKVDWDAALCKGHFISQSAPIPKKGFKLWFAAVLRQS